MCAIFLSHPTGIVAMWMAACRRKPTHTVKRIGEKVTARKWPIGAKIYKRPKNSIRFPSGKKNEANEEKQKEKIFDYGS